MKIKTRALLLLIIISRITHGQTPYTANDFITNGSIFIYQKSDFITNPQPLESLTTDDWNYQSPSEYVMDTTYARSVADLNVEDQFLDADLCLQQDESYGIFKIDDNKLWIIGILVFVNDLTLPIKLNEPMDILHFPLTVGNTIIRERSVPLTFSPEQLGITAEELGIPIEPDSIKVNFQISVNSNIYAHGIFNASAGAYMETNMQTLEYTVEALYWNIWWPISSLGNEQTSKTTNYWMPGYGLPICTTTLNPNDSVIGFKISPNFTTNLEIPIQNKLSIIPNPTNGFITIKSNSTEPTYLFDFAGRQLQTIPPFTNHIDLNYLPAGIYILKRNEETHKLIKY